MATGKGSFCWYELMTNQPEAAERFYGSVVGWTTREVGQTGQSYKLLLVGDTPAGGLLPMPEEVRARGARPGWMGYVGVDSVDEAAKQLAAVGGAVHRPPSDIPGAGRFAVVADPQHVTFVLFQPTPGAESPMKPGPGFVGWRELISPDAAAGFAFYSSLFGWTKGDAVDMGDMGIYQLFDDGGVSVGGMMNKPPFIPSGSWNFYFEVDGIDAAVERIKTAGGTVANGPHQVPGGTWIVQGVDPEGVFFALTSGIK